MTSRESDRCRSRSGDHMAATRSQTSLADPEPSQRISERPLAKRTVPLKKLTELCDEDEKLPPRSSTTGLLGFSHRLPSGNGRQPPQRSAHVYNCTNECGKIPLYGVFDSILRRTEDNHNHPQPAECARRQPSESVPSFGVGDDSKPGG